LPVDYLAIPVGSEVYLFVVKAPKGNPWREIEYFTQTEFDASQLGAVFFDLVPKRLEILDRTFELTSGLSPAANTVRFFWNPGQSSEILTVDYDLSTDSPLGDPAPLPFQGRDPFIIDARTASRTDRFYMIYVLPDGSSNFRVSEDAGEEWGPQRFIDSAGSDIVQTEGLVTDPLTQRNLVEVLQRRL
jgi:hypothetical protein